MIITIDPYKHYVIEKAGDQKTSELSISFEELNHADSCKYDFEKYLKKVLIERLLVDFEGGLKEDGTYILNYKKTPTKNPYTNDSCYRYELRMAPINKVNIKDLEEHS